MIKLNLANVPNMTQHDLEFAYGVGKAGLDIWPKGKKYNEVKAAVEAMGAEIERRKKGVVIVAKLPADARRNLAKLERRVAAKAKTKKSKRA